MRRQTRGYMQGFETGASAAALWRALTEPAALTAWLATEAMVEPRAGGRHVTVSRLFGRREAHIERSPNLAAVSDEDFERFFFIRSNPKGIIYERWRHIHGCGRFFNAVRDTVTDKFVTTYRAGEPKPAVASGTSEPAAWANRPPDQLNVKKPARKRTSKKGEA